MDELRSGTRRVPATGALSPSCSAPVQIQRDQPRRPPLIAPVERVRAKLAAVARSSIVGSQLSKTSTGCLRCWKALNSGSNRGANAWRCSSSGPHHHADRAIVLKNRGLHLLSADGSIQVLRKKGAKQDRTAPADGTPPAR